MKIGNNQNELQRVRCEANGVYGQMCQLNIGVYVFWHGTLCRIRATSQTLQQPPLHLNSPIAAMTTLKTIVEKKVISLICAS